VLQNAPHKAGHFGTMGRLLDKFRTLDWRKTESELSFFYKTKPTDFLQWVLDCSVIQDSKLYEEGCSIIFVQKTPSLGE
jgi:hypothetical protein